MCAKDDGFHPLQHIALKQIFSEEKKIMGVLMGGQGNECWSKKLNSSQGAAFWEWKPGESPGPGARDDRGPKAG